MNQPEALRRARRLSGEDARKVLCGFLQSLTPWDLRNSQPALVRLAGLLGTYELLDIASQAQKRSSLQSLPSLPVPELPAR